uniref:Uncharacterized protein n=1 Tax=Anopheles quadriannulatus TaxID=34691 RepID=A0A182XR37_ANOQN
MCRFRCVLFNQKRADPCQPADGDGVNATLH